jgi:hypothetical protein
MATNCLDSKLLKYNGTSQPQRELSALITDCALVDERSAADLILLARKYSAYLNYYDLTNTVTGDWQPLMSRDIAVTIAGLANWRIKDFNAFIKYVNDSIISAPTDDDAKKFFKLLFDFVFSLATALDQSFRNISSDIDYSTFLSVSIASGIANPLSTLTQYYAIFKGDGLIDETSVYTDPLMPLDSTIMSQNFQSNSLSSVFIANPAATVYPITISGPVHDEINHIITHNLFTGAYQSFINAVINIISRTPNYLLQTLDNYPSHEPHYALYLTFLKLFNYTQRHINQFTKKHLDFYYKDVLQLSNNAAQPDDVHLIFELQKNIKQHLIAKGTSFKAGKDANNIDIFYALTNDIVVQTANVQALKSIYLNKDIAPVSLFASSTANSEDGHGGKLLSADNSWYPFGNPSKIQPAAIGFAIASNVLFLNEGTRSITLTFNCNSTSGIAPSDLTGIFNIQLTGSKKWFTVSAYTASVPNTTSLTLSFTLEGDAPPIVPYAAKIHGGNFTQNLPMVQVMLTSYQSYQKIKQLKISGITVAVSVDAVKNLSLQNDDGKINASKPFKAFGDFPESGASFIIGSAEIFQKTLTQLTINFLWSQEPETESQVALSALVKGQWKALSTNNTVSLYASGITINRTTILIKKPIITILPTLEGFLKPKIEPHLESSIIKETTLATGDLGAKGEVAISGFINAGDDVYRFILPVVSTTGLETVVKSPENFVSNNDYTVATVDGFIKLELQGDEYSLSTYLGKIPVPTVTVNYDDSTPPNVTSYTVQKGTMPVPDPPVLKNITIAYSAQDVIALNDSSATLFNNRSSYYYHIEPFGYREMQPNITTDAVTFLPVFNVDDSKSNDDGGELWIGLASAAPDETFSILFQVSDGTANPLKNMTTVNWYYLSNNNWTQFKKQAVTDQTNNLTRSGLVIFNVPAEATLNNTRADSGLLWLKGVVDHDTDAVCNLIAVDVNAAEAQFEQDLTKNVEFTKAIPPNTISKPVVPDGAVKKTQQPFISFGGRPRETDGQFYLRVSERLRHKNRAITAWDYERLTLQAFPQIFKVKCISHTGLTLDEKTNTQKYSETLAGQVMVITIPDLTGLSAANLLKPYTSIGLLTEIQQYLQGLTSPFVKVNLSNPHFEEVQFDFQVTLHENYDPVYYLNLLNNEIEQFLTPWANGNPQSLQFGNTIEKSVVLNFVEERYYVDYVTCFQMNHIISRDGLIVKSALYNIDEAVASTARSILVSYYNEVSQIKHLISSPANCECDGSKGDK